MNVLERIQPIVLLSLLITSPLLGCTKQSNPVKVGNRASKLNTQSSNVSQKQSLDKILNDFIKQGAPGAILYVKSPGLEYTSAAGVLKEGGPALQADSLLRIASISKTFFGALVAILDGEGKLNLDAPIGAAFPDEVAKFKPTYDPKTKELWDPSVITLRMLLNQTSGVQDPLEQPDFQNTWFTHLKNKTAVTDQEAIASLFAAGLKYKPGSQHVYSNGGYMLAAHLIEKVMGHHYSIDLQNKIFAPLKMKDTFNGSRDAFDQTRLAHGYNDWTVPGFSDWFDLDQGNGYANGGLVSTAKDVATFFRAIFKDPHFPVGLNKAKFLKTFLPTRVGEYGLGIALDEQGCYSHDGHFMGYAGKAMYCSAQDLTIFMELTSDQPALIDLKAKRISEIKKLWNVKDSQMGSQPDFPVDPHSVQNSPGA